MYGGREKLQILLQWEKTGICPSGKLFTDNIFTAWLQWDWGTIMNLWDGLWLLNILHNNISKIADYAFFNLNQLRELDISKKCNS